MSTDYKAVFGIGYQVEDNGSIPEEDLDDGLDEYFERRYEEKHTLTMKNAGLEPKADQLHAFRTGNSFTGEDIQYFVVLTSPDFEKIKYQKQLIDLYIKWANLDTVGDFGCVGGLYVR